jgi:prevent-host-death family protein
MDISVTDFKQRCLDLIRRVERTGRTVTITRRGKVVARLQPPSPLVSAGRRHPWEELRGLGGRLLAGPGESVARADDFEALR